MNRFLLFPAACLIAVAAALAQSPPRQQFETGRVPLYFEPNLGQTSGQVQFVGRGGGMTLLLTADGAVMKLARHERTVGGTSPKVEAAAVRMRLKGSNSSARAELLEEQPGISAYFIGNDPKKWLGRVPHYGKVRYRELYAGIDLLYYGGEGRIEYDFEVKPGADASAIRLAYEGADRVRVDRGGDLVLETRLGELRQHKPRVYQEAGGRRVEVAASYRLEGGEVSFALGGYDRRRALVIDPVVSYATRLGGSGSDFAAAIAVDAAGALYVGGSTDSIDFPAVGSTAGSRTYVDAFIAKFVPHASGSVVLAYSVMLGGSEPGDVDHVSGLAVDGAGAVHACGIGSRTFPVLNHHRTRTAAIYESFALKINPYPGSGPVTLAYSTFLGEARASYAAVDYSGAAYFAGHSGPSDLPLVNPLQAHKGFFDAHVVKLNAYSGGMVTVGYATFIGGSDYDMVHGFRVDAAGAAYLYGQTYSSDFPSIKAYQGYQGDSDRFLAKLNAHNGAGPVTLAYSTHFGTSAADTGFWGGAQLALDSSGVAYVLGLGGTSISRFNPFTPYAEGSSFLAAFAPPSGVSNVSMKFLTFLPPGLYEGIAVAAGSIYLTGNTDIPGRVPKSPFVLKYMPSGYTYVLSYATAYGPPAAVAQHVVADYEGSAYLSAYVDPTPGGGSTDILLVKLKDRAPGAAVPVAVASSPPGVTFSVSGAGCGAGNYTAPTTLPLPLNGDCLFLWPDPVVQTPSQRLVFDGWGDLTALNPRTITPTGPATITGKFAAQYLLSLEVQPAGAGTISEPSRVLNPGFYERDRQFSLYPYAAACYQFVRWGGDASGSQAPYNLVLNRPLRITALFSRLTNAGPQFTATPGTIRFMQATGSYVQAVTINNNSPNTVVARLAVDNLVAGAWFSGLSAGPSGYTEACNPPAGSPYRDLGILAPGQRVTATLEFSKPANLALTYTPRLLIGVIP